MGVSPTVNSTLGRHEGKVNSPTWKFFLITVGGPVFVVLASSSGASKGLIINSFGEKHVRVVTYKTFIWQNKA